MNASQPGWPPVRVGTLPWTMHTPLRGPLAGGRLREDTGYQIGHSLEDGIRAYADWLRTQPGLCR